MKNLFIMQINYGTLAIGKKNNNMKCGGFVWTRLRFSFPVIMRARR